MDRNAQALDDRGGDAASASGSRSPNSSPPTRPATSDTRFPCRNTRASPWSRASPPSWPKRSLTCLRSSQSVSTIAKGRPERSARPISSCSRSSKPRLLRRPVRLSVTAARCSRCKAWPASMSAASLLREQDRSLDLLVLERDRRVRAADERPDLGSAHPQRQPQEPATQVIRYRHVDVCGVEDAPGVVGQGRQGRNGGDRLGAHRDKRRLRPAPRSCGRVRGRAAERELGRLEVEQPAECPRGELAQSADRAQGARVHGESRQGREVELERRAERVDENEHRLDERRDRLDGALRQSHPDRLDVEDRAAPARPRAASPARRRSPVERRCSRDRHGPLRETRPSCFAMPGPSRPGRA